jgi:isocitrate dehydrogenase
LGARRLEEYQRVATTLTEKKTPITVAYGDGIGPEIMDATLSILDAAGARLEPERIEIGERVYTRGSTSGIEPESWDSLRRTGVFLKAPITTPQGGGFKSLNVTVRKTLGQYANVRPSVAYHPFVATKHPGMDMVIVRENEEDVYGGIEYRQTADVMECLKLITRPGCERIIRYAFEYARVNNRRKVTAFTKDNIMKMTDGLFHAVFDEIAKDYPTIENEHWIVDIGAAKMADTPEAFDVIVTENLYGDVLSDVAAQIAGSVGLAGAANIGDHFAMFEAIHGSAPRRAGQNLANPSGLLLGAVMMLVHIGQPEIAERVHNAWLRTIEDGIHTYDIYDASVSTSKVGTKEFAQAVVDRVGQLPQTLHPISYNRQATMNLSRQPPAPRPAKSLVGVDVYVDWSNGMPDALAATMGAVGGQLELATISSRGTKVWPGGFPETLSGDHWSCRYLAKSDGTVDHKSIADLLERVSAAGIDFIKTENLYDFDGKPGYSLAQGQ